MCRTWLINTTTAFRVPQKYKPDALAEDEYDFPKQEHAYQNQLAKAKFPVKHSTIEVGDHVKIRVKPAGYGDYKETFNSWSNEVYTVERIDKGAQDGQDRFHLTGYRRPLLRFELLKEQKCRIAKYN